MIKRDGQYQVDVRKEMRGGSGEVKIEHLWMPKDEMQSKTRMCARLTLASGCSIGFHAHEQEEEVFYLVQGEAEADDNGTTVTLKAGDTILTGGGAGHAIKNVGGNDLVILAMISCF